MMQESWQKYWVQYQLWDGGPSRRKSFRAETDAMVWIKNTRPYYWRLDVHMQVYLQEGGLGAPIMEKGGETP